MPLNDAMHKELVTERVRGEVIEYLAQWDGIGKLNFYNKKILIMEFHLSDMKNSNEEYFKSLHVKRTKLR